jgi:hypothetical protein
VGTQSQFEVWWADARMQVRLKLADPRSLWDDFGAWQVWVRPNWSAEQGQAMLAQS